jgi:mycothiol system anti-sigma-R factor
MECQRVRETMFLVNDHEVEPELLAPFREHLGHCPRCAQHFDYLQKLLCMVRERCMRMAAPDHLRERILGSFPHRDDARPAFRRAFE